MAEFRIPKIEFDQDDLDRLEKLIDRMEGSASVLLKYDLRAAEITKLEHIIDDRESEIARLKAELKNCQELLAYAMAEGESLRLQLEIEKDYE